VGLEPQYLAGDLRNYRDAYALMQDRDKEGCWNITNGYVFIQEPSEYV
jgi:hypothetical protein